MAEEGGWCYSTVLRTSVYRTNSTTKVATAVTALVLLYTSTEGVRGVAAPGEEW